MGCCIIHETNITAETKGLLYIKERKNLIIQIEATCGSNDTISMKFYGTIVDAAQIDSDQYWADITDLLFKQSEISCTNDTLRAIAIIDTNCAFEKIKVIVTPIATEPNNEVEIYYDY